MEVLSIATVAAVPDTTCGHRGVIAALSRGRRAKAARNRNGN
jgi:hypothetical protein